jgi:hypothetical protein
MFSLQARTSKYFLCKFKLSDRDIDVLEAGNFVPERRGYRYKGQRRRSVPSTQILFLSNGDIVIDKKRIE